VAIIVVAVPFALVSQAQAAIIAALVSALAGVAAVGIAVWAALRQPPMDGSDGSQVSSEVATNKISGTVHGDVVQAQEVRGGIRFGRAE
jgi:hypothetical protein